MVRRARLAVESLESRYAPATLTGSNTVTYQDVDGDTVTVKASLPIFDGGSINFLFKFDNGFVNTDNSVKQQLQFIDLTTLANPQDAAGLVLTITATRSSVNGGDGFANLGYLNATGIDLGQVNIDGDLGRIDAGDADSTTPALTNLTIVSWGRFGITTQDAGNLNSTLNGKVGTISVKRDFVGVFLTVDGGSDADVTTISIGGSLIGGATASAGEIFIEGDLATLSIKDSIIGGDGNRSGVINVEGKLTNATIGGSIIGGTNGSAGLLFSELGIGTVRIGRDLLGGNANAAGRIQSTASIGSVSIGGSILCLMGGGSSTGISSGGDLGPVSVKGSIQGGAASSSATIISSGKIASVTIGGSLIGGIGGDSGKIFATGDIGPIKITASLTGGAATKSGAIISQGNVASISIGGSVVGGTGTNSGYISVGGNLGPVSIKGNLSGGNVTGASDVTSAGTMETTGGRIVSVTIFGSIFAGLDDDDFTGEQFNCGSIRSAQDIGSLTVKGSIIGTSEHSVVISARGQANPSATSDAAIGRINVTGRMEYADILAGYAIDGSAENGDASIGAVTVGSDWLASNLVAGAEDGADDQFGVADNLIAGGDPNRIARIASVLIKGQAFGTAGGADHFGIVAEQIGSLKVNSITFALTSGAPNEDAAIGSTGDFQALEV